MFSSLGHVHTGLVRVGYIADEIVTTTVYLAAKLNKPILLEGPPGSGKTELAYAVAKVTGAEVEQLQCFEGINEEKAIGKFDEALQRLAVELSPAPPQWNGTRSSTSCMARSSSAPAHSSRQCSIQSPACY